MPKTSSHFVTFGLADELLAAPVEAVREVLAVPPLTRVPNAPSSLLGIIDVRGGSVPVIDMRRKFGLPPAETTSNSRILVLDVAMGDRSVTIGALADRVFEVITMDDAALQPPPDIGVRWHSAAIAGIARRDGRFVILLDLPAVFNADTVALTADEADPLAVPA